MGNGTVLGQVNFKNEFLNMGNGICLEKKNRKCLNYIKFDFIKLG